MSDKPIISSVRHGLLQSEESDTLGLLAELGGSWKGEGFNLIARPDKQGNSPLFLELNQTAETLTLSPISSAIPNRGFAVDDINLFGLTYLQKISDSVTKGALHIEPGIWVHVPSQDTSATSQSVFRLGTIPHGNALLAEGVAIQLKPFNGNPFKPSDHSLANTAPFKVGDPMHAPGTQGGFPPYNLSDQSANAVNFRTPFGNPNPQPLPTHIHGVPMQDVINDPALLLDVAVKNEHIEEMVVINVATVAQFSQEQKDGSVKNNVIAGGGGGVENIPFLAANADAATVLATFWIEKIRAEHGHHHRLQLQYVQTVLLNFPILGTEPPVNLSWPHVSVATLHKTFGGQ